MPLWGDEIKERGPTISLEDTSRSVKANRLFWNVYNEGRHYVFSVTEKNEEKIKKQFSTRFDKSAHETSYESNGIILQRDATCIPAPVKEYKDETKFDAIYSFTAKIREDNVAQMLGKFTDGVKIGELDLTISFDITADGSQTHKYINESARTDKLSLTIKVGDKAWSSTNYSPFKWLTANAHGVFCDSSTIRKFILGIKSLDKIQINLMGQDYILYPVITNEFILELCKRHTHVSIWDILVGDSVASYVWNAREEQCEITPRKWRSIQVRVALNELISCLGQHVPVRVVEDEVTFDFSRTRKHLHLAGKKAHCFFFDHGLAIFVGSGNPKGLPPQSRSFFLRVESNVNMEHHWAIKDQRMEEELRR